MHLLTKFLASSIIFFQQNSTAAFRQRHPLLREYVLIRMFHSSLSARSNNRIQLFCFYDASEFQIALLRWGGGGGLGPFCALSMSCTMVFFKSVDSGTIAWRRSAAFPHTLSRGRLPCDHLVSNYAKKFLTSSIFSMTNSKRNIRIAHRCILANTYLAAVGRSATEAKSNDGFIWFALIHMGFLFIICSSFSQKTLIMANISFS